MTTTCRGRSSINWLPANVEWEELRWQRATGGQRCASGGGFNEHHQSAGKEETVGQVTSLHLFINVITVTQRRFSRPSNGRWPSGDAQPSQRTLLPVRLAACQHSPILILPVVQWRVDSGADVTAR